MSATLNNVPRQTTLLLPLMNLVSLFIDYCHGAMCGSDALYKGSPSLVACYIGTDGELLDLRQLINEVGVAMGCVD